MSAYRHVSEEERLEIYDRLASKWALKMEARMAQKRLLKKHPDLTVTISRRNPGVVNARGIFVKSKGVDANGMMV